MKQTTDSTTTVNGERLTVNDKQSIIPNIFTLLNLICGCIAIVYLLQNGIAIVETGATPDNPIGQELTLLPERI